ncbi:MAG TPA: hypothetical protein DDZ51_14970 [Planctomycetaceae bacterium]|nr:hypothetical protein [Planctomycetaceae bacterium]
MKPKAGKAKKILKNRWDSNNASGFSGGPMVHRARRSMATLDPPATTSGFFSTPFGQIKITAERSGNGTMFAQPTFHTGS